MVLMCIESLSDNDTHILLLILYQLVPQLSVASSRSSAAAADDDDSDYDDDMMDVDCQVNSQSTLLTHLQTLVSHL